MTLLGLGDTSAKLSAEIDGFLLRAPKPNSTQVVDFLKLYPQGERTAVAQALVARGVDAKAIANALNWFAASDSWNTNTIYGVLAVISAMASGFHGYRRNKSIAWGAVWFVLGGIFPIFTVVVATAQGFAKPKA